MQIRAVMKCQTPPAGFEHLLVLKHLGMKLAVNLQGAQQHRRGAASRSCQPAGLRCAGAEKASLVLTLVQRSKRPRWYQGWN